MFRHHLSSLAGRFNRLSLGLQLWLTLWLPLGLMLIAVGYGYQIDLQRYQQQQLTQLAQLIGQQTSASTAPLLLANDRLSLNTSLQLLNQQPLVAGSNLYDSQSKLLLQSGQAEGQAFDFQIKSNQSKLGSLTLYLDPARLASPALPFTLGLGLLALALLAITTWLFGRQLNLDTTVPIQPVAPPATETEPTIPITDEQPDSVEAATPAATQSGDKVIDTLEPTPDLQPDQEVTSDASVQTGYLFYINHHVGGSDTLTTSEREQLLVRYRKALEQVSRLYKGQLSEDPLNNWCVSFSPLSEDQSHGINALCAAQLFNALYRGINTEAIHNFSPALNMKLVLMSGPLDRFDNLAEDALLLSDQIQDNDLITEQTLFDTPILQERLLDKAQYRKFDDQTYLVSALNSDYQTLIERQAEHFLKQTAEQSH